MTGFRQKIAILVDIAYHSIKTERPINCARNGNIIAGLKKQSILDAYMNVEFERKM